MEYPSISFSFNSLYILEYYISNSVKKEKKEKKTLIEGMTSLMLTICIGKKWERFH